MIAVLILAAALQTTTVAERISNPFPVSVAPSLVRCVQCVERGVRREIGLPAPRASIAAAYEIRDPELRQQILAESFSIAEQIRNLYRAASDRE